MPEGDGEFVPDKLFNTIHICPMPERDGKFPDSIFRSMCR
jgi:hypothetical protein